jgi:hypothetical protein
MFRIALGYMLGRPVYPCLVMNKVGLISREDLFLRNTPQASSNSRIDAYYLGDIN